MSSPTPKPAILTAPAPSLASGKLASWTAQRDAAEAQYSGALLAKSNAELTPDERRYLLRAVAGCFSSEDIR